MNYYKYIHTNRKTIEQTKKDNIRFYKKMCMETPFYELKKEKLREYTENEDINAHSDNYLLLAKCYGTPNEIKIVKAIIKHKNKIGHLNAHHNNWMYQNINPYYKNLTT
jgi:hypothetical protein